jgi:hypothetical protein
MNKIVFIIAGVVLAGCATPSVLSQGSLPGPDRDRMVHIAQQELARQHANLPHRYDVIVEGAEAGNELQPSRQVYQVSFSFVYRGKKQIIYTVIIDKRSGRVEMFSDSRAFIPSKT